MKKWSAIILLALAQFIMVLDSTVMNVSISTVVKDLDTTVASMQATITFYTLTMAALMLTGGKLGDIWGRKKVFLIGLGIYGIGAFITAISPNIQTLMIGWSLVEGLGAVLVIPATAALVAARYEGRDRITAFAIIGAMAGAAAAAGPLIGGFVTTFLSWRYVFAFESVIVVIILFFWKHVPSSGKLAQAKLDIPSTVLSASGMSLLIFGILQSKVWGWVKPMTVPEIFGYPIAPFGISIVTFLIFAGILLLAYFLSYQKTLQNKGKDPLFDVTVLKIPQLRSGLAVQTSQSLVIGASFFVMPVYLEMVIGLDALQTGIRIIPLSISVITFSMLGSKLIDRFSPKRIVKFGQLALIVGVAIITYTIDPQLQSIPLFIGMFILGAGLGLLASQLGNINMNAVDKRHASEVGGIQGTALNLGSSLGTAIIGSILIMTLSTGFSAKISADPQVPESVKQAVSAQANKGIPILSTADVTQIANQEGFSQAQTAQLLSFYTDSQLAGLRQAMVFLLLLTIVSLLLSRNLPDNKPQKQSGLKLKDIHG
ncbi:MFS transporter [Candidatus Saccharibacteria bacterium]|nr:MFS transporter [Candidatus Saccharibacteria bacterium]